MAEKILASKKRYQTIESALGIPWFFVGCLHAMEAGCNFQAHLHNGDSLQARTRQVPAGRPAKGEPPFTWEESAIDACIYDGLDKVRVWTVERMLYEAEGYNGWGYRLYHKDVLSPYLWSGTNWGSKPGKYTADGRWSPTAVSRQTGLVLLLAKLAELDPSINLVLETSEPVVQPDPEWDTEIVATTYPKAQEPRVEAAAKSSRTIKGSLIALLGATIQWGEAAIKTLLDAASNVSDWYPIQTLFDTAGIHISGIGFALAVGGVVMAVGRRLNAAAVGKEG